MATYVHPDAVLQLVLPNSLSTTEVYGSMGLDLFDKRLYTLANYLDNHWNLHPHNPVSTWKDRTRISDSCDTKSSNDNIAFSTD